MINCPHCGKGINPGNHYCQNYRGTAHTLTQQITAVVRRGNNVSGAVQTRQYHIIPKPQVQVVISAPVRQRALPPPKPNYQAEKPKGVPKQEDWLKYFITAAIFFTIFFIFKSTGLL